MCKSGLLYKMIIARGRRILVGHLLVLGPERALRVRVMWSPTPHYIDSWSSGLSTLWGSSLCRFIKKLRRI